MEEIKLYDINSTEFYQLLDHKRMELKDKNIEYKKLSDKFYAIMDKYPNLQLILEEDEEIELNKEECKMLQEISLLYMKMSDFEEREIFFLGARENYFYFKNLGLIK